MSEETKEGIAVESLEFKFYGMEIKLDREIIVCQK